MEGIRMSFFGASVRTFPPNFLHTDYMKFPSQSISNSISKVLNPHHPIQKHKALHKNEKHLGRLTILLCSSYPNYYCFSFSLQPKALKHTPGIISFLRPPKINVVTIQNPSHSTKAYSIMPPEVQCSTPKSDQPSLNQSNE